VHSHEIDLAPRTQSAVTIAMPGCHNLCADPLPPRFPAGESHCRSSRSSS
jgi:hypothetical protein